jgi:hypothetical protein
MSLIFKGHPDYKISNELKQKQYQINCGNFYAKCTKYDVPFGYYPSVSCRKMLINYSKYKWKEMNEIKIYDRQDNLLISKSTFYTPCFNLYGGGFDLEDTFYTIIEDGDNNSQEFNIYDLSDKLIKTIKITECSDVDIYITLFNNIKYVIMYAYNVLSVTNLDELEYINYFTTYSNSTKKIPLLGQNKMYAVTIVNNHVIFNTGHVCLIDNINYDTSKWLLLGNPLYNPNLFDNDGIKHFVHTHGIFSAEYDYKDHCGHFDSNIGKFAKGTIVTFKENGNVIFEMKSRSSPSIILYGDGKTREGTKFCIGDVSIFDFNQKLIRETCIGADAHHDIQRVNDKYAISTSIEVCTHHQFSGLIDLELFFNQKGDEEQIKPYDNARTYIPMCDDDVLYATCADEDGFILNNGIKLRYEDAEDFDFSNGDGYNRIDFSKLGYNDEQIKQMNDTILRGGAVYIPISLCEK